jgi:hypothetical protein
MNPHLKLSVLSGLLLFLLSTNPASMSGYATLRPSVINYYLNADGSVLVELVFSNVSSQVLEVPLEPGYDASTLYAVDSDGASLPVDLVGDEAVINVMSSVEWVKLAYVVNNSEIIDGVVLKFTLRPQGKCVIHVPEELLLLTYSGNPAISMSDETLLLEYEDAGVVEVTLVLLQPTTQTTVTQQPGTRNVVLTTAVIAALAAILLAVSLLYLRSRKHR